jgi:hypothetical protein
MIRSLLRSTIAIEPSGYRTARSPEWKLPPRKASFVASGSWKYYNESHQRIYLQWKLSSAYLFHRDVTSRDDLSDCLSIRRDIDEIVVSLVQEHHPSFISCGESMPLSSYIFRSFLQAQICPLWAQIQTRKGTISLTSMSLADNCSLDHTNLTARLSVFDE